MSAPTHWGQQAVAKGVVFVVSDLSRRLGTGVSGGNFHAVVLKVLKNSELAGLLIHDCLKV
ncbi:hypothetical protein [Nitrogeniibacter aestuarii]|uniref:hypothetical protein n=1 Tax=Nitrogeniibacter aestuarii TaxID=2815343 RepID=UPI001E3E5199|nr:hypothetical protein [Nitrogeniibacter aestuarii]